MQVSPQEVTKKARMTSRWMAWLPITLLMVGFAVGVSAAPANVVDPNWGGTMPENISDSPQDLALQPVIAAGADGKLAIAWRDERAGDPEPNIYATRSYDNGHTWSAPSAVSSTVNTSRLPDALIVEDQVFVAWSDSVGYTYTLHEAEIGGGARFIPLPHNDAPSGYPTRPSLVAGSDRLHVAFNGGIGAGKSHILYASRLLATATWPTATRVYTSTAGGGSWFPMLAISSEDAEDKLHVVWEELHNSKRRTIMYISGTVSGGNVAWASSPLTLSTGITLSVQPDIAAESNGNLHVVWGEVEGERSYVRYARYDAGSGSWDLPAERVDVEPVDVNELSPTDTAPRLALLEGEGEVVVCVAWHGFREGASAEEVLLNCSPDGGESWPTTYNMSRSPADVEEEVDISIWPSIEFDSAGTLHGVWEQRVRLVVNTSYYEIYHTFTSNQVFLPLVARNY